MSNATGSSPVTRFFGGLSIGIGATIGVLAILMSLFLMLSLAWESDPSKRSSGILAIVMFGAIPLAIGAALFFMGRRLRRGSGNQPPIQTAEPRKVPPRPTDRFFGRLCMIAGAIIVLIAVHMSLLLILMSAEHPTDPRDGDIKYFVLTATGVIPIGIGSGIFWLGRWLDRRWHAAHPTGHANLEPGLFRAGFGAVLMGLGGVITVVTGLVILLGLVGQASSFDVNIVEAIGAAIIYWYGWLIGFPLFIGLELLGTGFYLRRRSRASIASSL